MENDNRLAQALAESFYNSTGSGLVVPPKTYQHAESLFGKEWADKYLIINKRLK